MKIAFVHDHPFCEVGNDVYSAGGMPSNVWSRYLINDDKLFVFGRRMIGNAKILSSCDNVSFSLSNFYKSPFSLIKNWNLVHKELADFLSDKDCIIARVPSILGNLAADMAYKTHKPLLIEVVADAYESFRHYGNLAGIIFAPIYHRWTKTIVKRSTYALYVTQNFLQERYPSQGKTIGCTNAIITPVDYSILQQRLKKITSRKSTKIICGQIGDVSVKFKGSHIMLKAMSILKRKGIEVEYHVVGGGNPKKLYSLATSFGVDGNFFYDGYIAHDQISSFIDSIDLYVHPSFQEGLPRAVIEAISRACPCVTSNVAGTPELLSDDYMHNPGDAIKLAADIERVLKDKEKETALAVANFEKGKEYYNNILSERRKIFYNDFFSNVNNDWSTNI